MKKLTMAACLLLGMASTASAETNFIFDVKPLSLLSSSDVDGFRVSRSGYSETIDGSGSWYPMVNVGLGIATKPAHYDFTVGVGYLYNSAFNGSFLQGDVGAHFKLGPVNLGPHIGLISFGEMDWDSDSSLSNSEPNLTFDNSSGIKGGIDFTVGKKIYFIASLDYISVDEAKVKSINSGWTTNRSSIDLSGWAISMGMSGRF